MSWWRNILRLLGVSNDARVHIQAPGIDVVITGDPEQVRSILGVVRTELERSARTQPRGRRRIIAGSESQIVRPTELDEMDSPYAIPGVVMEGRRKRNAPRERVKPSEREADTDERVAPPLRPSPLRSLVNDLEEPATLLPEGIEAYRPEIPEGETNPEQEVRQPATLMRPATRGDDDEPEPEVTAIEKNPSAPYGTPAVRISAASSDEREVQTVEVSPSRGTRAPSMRPVVSQPFVADNGPTLMPSESSSEMRPRPREPVHEVTDSDIREI